MKHGLVGILAAALVLTAVAGPLAQGRIIQRVLVKVNGEIFTEQDLEELQIQALQDKNKQVKSAEDLQNSALIPLLLEVTPPILASVIDQLILVQRARELGFKVTEAQYKDAIEGLKKENKMDDAMFKQALEQQGMTMEQLRQSIERHSLIQMVQSQEIMSHVAMTEEEARQYYDKHQNEFLSPPTVTLREILVKAPAPTAPATGGLTFGATASTEAASRAKIEAALERARKGEDFAAIVGDVSEAASKAKGGLVGPVNLDDLSQLVHDAIDKVQPGGITDIVRTGAGFQIFKLETRTAQTVLPFDQVHSSIMQKVYDERSKTETKKYLDRLRVQALIEWKDDNLKKMYEARMAGIK